MLISHHHGIVDAGALLPVEDADTIAVCGLLDYDPQPFNPLVAALPRILHLPASRAGDWNVATIALDVGNDSEAAFSRAFRRIVGMPLAAWRKAQARA